MNLKRSSALFLHLVGIQLFFIIFICQASPVIGIMEVESIEILPKRSESLRKQDPDECDHQDGSAYNQCYGRGMVFRVLPSPDQSSWQYHASQYMRAFSEQVEASGIGANSVVASFNFKWFKEDDDNIRFTLPYLFLSGAREKTAACIYLTEDEFKNSGTPSFIRRQIAQANEEFEKDKEKRKPFFTSLEHIVRHYFPKEFFACQFKDSVFVLHPSSAPSKNKQPALTFRHFVYSHFIDPSAYEDYRNVRAYVPFVAIINNLHGYSQGCTGEEIKGVAHDLILELALMESYLRERNAQALLNVFGGGNIDDLFNQGSHDGDDEDKGISYCFHHSEQALMRHLLEDNTAKGGYHNGVVAMLIDFLKCRLSKGTYMEKFKLRIIDKNDEIASRPNIADDLPSLGQLSSQPSSSTPKRKQETTLNAKELTVQIEDSMVIDLDIISQRHICRYCRGSLFFSRERIAALLRRTLVEQGIVFSSGGRGKKGGKASKAEECYEKMAEFLRNKGHVDFRTIIIKFSEVEFSLVATAVGECISAELMGKTEDEK